MKTQFPIISINGHHGATLSPLDRGFAYGDGVYETCRVIKGQVPLWPLHLNRLLASCERLQIPCDSAQLDVYIKHLIGLPEVAELPNAILKVTVTRGIADRGYRLPKVCVPTYCLVVSEGTPLHSEPYTRGVSVRICGHRLSAGSALAGLKHMNRLEQVLARAEWDDDYHEGLLLDGAGAVIEATSSNLFVVMEGELVTPDLSHTGVEGVMRRLILTYLAPSIGLRPRVDRLVLDDLQRADEVFICNSLAGICPVLSIAFSPVLSRHYTAGQITRRLQMCLEQILSDPSRLELPLT